MNPDRIHPIIWKLATLIALLIMIELTGPPSCNDVF